MPSIRFISISLLYRLFLNATVVVFISNSSDTSIILPNNFSNSVLLLSLIFGNKLDNWKPSFLIWITIDLILSEASIKGFKLSVFIGSNFTEYFILGSLLFIKLDKYSPIWLIEGPKNFLSIKKRYDVGIIKQTLGSKRSPSICLISSSPIFPSYGFSLRYFPIQTVLFLGRYSKPSKEEPLVLLLKGFLLLFINIVCWLPNFTVLSTGEDTRIISINLDKS